ncbi:glycosyl transferase family 2 [Kushneria sinocarnis]|uniref:Glycosyl transferase family 2 n=1 Tax=Kushneria sinocarnis TaxID=595502 RepID=A0A420WY19_9GAMM|nr:glycosyltransferase [Kushneria sinocarnis]RKR06055.1 glycosyl transferase family 2 [Kushneria sinocarnis]
MKNRDSQSWLTVIIAAYNVQDYIEQSLRSVLSQIDERVRLIIVNDGSRDDTLSVIEQTVALFPDRQDHVQIVDQENAGPSEARNRALDLLDTPYVTFLDGDDFWAQEYYATVLDLVEEPFSERYDLLEFNAMEFRQADDGTSSQELLTFNSFEDFRGEITSEKLREIAINSKWYIWSRVYRSALFEKLRFPRGERYEDLFLTPFVYLEARTVSATRAPLVYYRVNFGGIVTNPTQSDIKDIESHIRSHLKHADECGNNAYKSFLVLAACQTLLYYKIITNNYYGYTRSIPLIRAWGRELKPLVKRHQVQLPLKTRLLFVSPELSNFYTWLKTRR